MSHTNGNEYDWLMALQSEDGAAGFCRHTGLLRKKVKFLLHYLKKCWGKKGHKHFN